MNKEYKSPSISSCAQSDSSAKPSKHQATPVDLMGFLAIGGFIFAAALICFWMWVSVQALQ